MGTSPEYGDANARPSTVPPVVAVKPTLLTWVLLIVSPIPVLLGVACLFGRYFGWAALFIASGAFNFARSAGILWRWWHRVRPESGQLPAFAPQTGTATFISNDVSWAPARFQAGLSFQPGWVVVRPGWVAFLPSAAPAHLLGEMAWAVGGFVRAQLGTLAYDFPAVCRQGPQAFDQTILHLASQGGRILRANEGDLVKLAKGLMFRADEKTLILSDILPPDVLLAGWRVGKVQFNARETAKVFALITAIPALLAGVCGIAAIVGDDPSIKWGVPFWGVLVVFGWAGYFVAYRRSKRV